MNTIALNRRMALSFGIAIALLQSGRCILWGRWPRPLEWFFFLDAYMVSALLLWGVVLVGRNAPAGRLVLAAGWGFAGGILSRSFFEQLADPSRHSGHQMVVLVVKGALLAFAVMRFMGAIRTSPVSSGGSPA